MKYFIYCFSLIIFSCFSSCELLEELPGEEPDENAVPLIQFYANPQKFSRGAGKVITSITINGYDYAPKTFIDNCTEMYPVPSVTSSYNGSEYFQYKINMKNYDSLDAMMSGLEFKWEYYQGIIYLNDLESGCNTLEVTDGGGAQLFVLQLNN